MQNRRVLIGDIATWLVIIGLIVVAIGTLLRKLVTEFDLIVDGVFCRRCCISLAQI